MAWLRNSIASELFLEILGVPDILKSRLELLARRGVDGVGIWDDGARGMPFTVRTRSDAMTLGDAEDAFVRYAALIDADPVQVVFRGMNLSVLGALYQVLDVRPVEVGPLASSSLGLWPPSLGWVEADWDLIAVPAST